MIDPLTAVDANGLVLKIGSIVSISKAVVIGLRASKDNHGNVYIVPGFHTVKTIDPTNPLNGQVDGQGVLVSGYNVVRLFASKDAKADAIVAEAESLDILSATPDVEINPQTPQATQTIDHIG